MENTRKRHAFTDIGNDARRQYIDTQSVFSAWEDAVQEAAEVRGGMYWKRQGKSDYLIRTSVRNTQKSLGVRSPETEAIHAKFTQRKADAEGRVSDLQAQLVRQQRMNRALHVGRAPQLLVDILAEVARSGVAEHFTVIGTHALYAYEAAAGVRIESPDALAKGFDLRRNKPRRHRTSTRRDVIGMTEDEADFWAVYARRADVLLNAPAFSSLIISPSGHMARMRTVAPATFMEFKRWMAVQADRDRLKAPRDVLQAELVEDLVAEYLPQLVS